MNVQEALGSVGLSDIYRILVDNRVSCLADIKYFSVVDLKALAFNPVQAEKL